MNGKGEAGENPQSDFAAKDNQKVWYRTSDQDSMLFAVDKKGDTIAHMIYDPWGRPLLKTYTDSNYSGLENLNNFTGYTWDETLGLYFAQNRFYDPENHRFTQEDPVKDGRNWYAYCGNDPVNNTDPTGELTVPRVVTKQFTAEVDGRNYVVPVGAIVQYKLWSKTKDGFAYIYYKNYDGYVHSSFLRYPTLGDMTGEIIRNQTFVTSTQNGNLSEMFYAAGFIRTDDGVYHARQDALQRFGGYNSFYDNVFDYVTDMRTKQFPFKYGNIYYVFWVWKGDYLNLGAGAELGIYKRLTGSKQWIAVTNLGLFMGVTLRYHDRINRKTVKFFDYYPNRTHWWITGFNPYQQRIRACDLEAEYSVTFTNQHGMYNAFKRQMKASGYSWRFTDWQWNAKLLF